jgi:photoactive yellow protein
MDDGQSSRGAGMSVEEIDVLPFGAIVIDQSGRVLRYNQFEARLARLDPRDVIGKNFFRDIAPCTAVRAFEGRMRDFTASDDRVSTTFDYRFAFAHGPVDVAITFIKLTGDDATVLIAVERLPVRPKPVA